MIANSLLLLYPLLVHAAIITDSGWLEFAALVLLASNVLGTWLARGRAWAWLVECVAIVASVMFVMIGEGRLFLYAASVLSPLALMWFFGSTLFAQRIPLVTRIARGMIGPLPEPVRIYTRHVTQLWALALAAIALANGLLAVFATPVVWSLFANFINYFIAGTLFVAEWLFRCWYLRAYQSMTWRSYMRALVRLDLRQLLA